MLLAHSSLAMASFIWVYFLLVLLFRHQAGLLTARATVVQAQWASYRTALGAELAKPLYTVASETKDASGRFTREPTNAFRAAA
jgi:uncharacterized membrane protein YjgN (DUF898 family)